jgi:hypothetical protein
LLKNSALHQAPLAAQGFGFVSGHDFSHAANAAKSMGALAPEGGTRCPSYSFQQVPKSPRLLQIIPFPSVRLQSESPLLRWLPDFIEPKEKKWPTRA